MFPAPRGGLIDAHNRARVVKPTAVAIGHVVTRKFLPVARIFMAWDLRRASGLVPLYEVVLLRPHGRRDVRVSDTPLPVHDPFELDHATWKVVRVDYPVNDLLIERRYVCERVPAPPT